MGRDRRLVLSWAALAVVTVVTLAVGTFAGDGSRSPEERADALADTIKCPTCRSQSVAESDAPASQAIRAEIARRIDEGQSDAEIRGYFSSRYGEEILLTPAGSGLVSLVWILPVAGLVLGAAGLGFAFWRWRRWAGLADAEPVPSSGS